MVLALFFSFDFVSGFIQTLTESIVHSWLTRLICGERGEHSQEASYLFQI